MENENENMEKSQNDESKQENVTNQDKRVFRLKKISCPSCGGSVEITNEHDLATCPFCHNEFSVKKDLDFTIDRDVLIKYNGESTEVEVPSGVRAIAPTAFSSQSDLTKIVLPEGLNELRANTFYECIDLETVVLPESLDTIPQMTFTECINLKSIELPKNLKRIETMAFYGCKSLTSITIPPMVESVESNAFSGCKNLETIYCNENTKIRGTDFRDCVNLRSIIVLDSNTGETISRKRVIQDDIGFFKVVEDDGSAEREDNADEDSGTVDDGSAVEDSGVVGDGSTVKDEGKAEKPSKISKFLGGLFGDK
jgi:ribosomal protein S27AE